MPTSYKDARASAYWRAISQLADGLDVLLTQPYKTQRQQEAWEKLESRPRYAHLLRFLYEAFSWAAPNLSQQDEAQWEALCRKRLVALRPFSLSYEHKKLLGQIKSKKKPAPALPLLEQPAARSVSVDSYQNGKQLPIFHPPYNELKLFS